MPASTAVRDARARGRVACAAATSTRRCAVSSTPPATATQFVHRTGHSIGAEVHGNGANIDGFETPDTRRLLPGTCFSIEPGIYLPGEFGVRSELNVFVDGDDSRCDRRAGADRRRAHPRRDGAVIGSR